MSDKCTATCDYLGFKIIKLYHNKTNIFFAFRVETALKRPCSNSEGNVIGYTINHFIVFDYEDLQDAY